MLFFVVLVLGFRILLFFSTDQARHTRPPRGRSRPNYSDRRWSYAPGHSSKNRFVFNIVFHRFFIDFGSQNPSQNQPKIKKMNLKFALGFQSNFHCFFNRFSIDSIMPLSQKNVFWCRGVACFILSAVSLYMYFWITFSSEFSFSGSIFPSKIEEKTKRRAIQKVIDFSIVFFIDFGRFWPPFWSPSFTP